MEITDQENEADKMLGKERFVLLCSKCVFISSLADSSVVVEYSNKMDLFLYKIHFKTLTSF